MHVLKILEKNQTLYLPEDLSECDANQYIDSAELIFRYQFGDLDYETFRIHLFYKLLNMKESKSFINVDDDLKYSNVYNLSSLLDSFFEYQDEQKVLKQYYIDPAVKKIRVLWANYFGPSDGFENLKFGEYRDCLRFFNDFNATGDLFYIYLMTAVLYRRARFRKSNGDVRIKYDSHSLEKRAKLFQKSAPFGFAFGTYLLFASFQKYLTDAKIMWSGQDLDFSILFESGGTASEVPGIGMDAVAFTMAENGAFGDISKLDDSNFWQVMVRMYDLRKTDMDRKKQEENASTK